MKFYLNNLLAFIILFIYSVFPQTSKGKIEVFVDEISGDKGQIIVHLYDSEEDFLESPVKTELSKIVNRKASVVFKDVPKGIYAVGVIYDENNNNEIDFNFIGMPTEDVAASNNAKGFFGPPSFDDAKFEIITDSIALKIKM